MKGQSSVEFVAIIGIALVLAAPFVIEAQQSAIDLTKSSEDAEFYTSFNDLSDKIDQVASSGEQTKRTVTLEVTSDIEEIYILDRALVFEQQRGDNAQNFSQIFDYDIEADMTAQQGFYTYQIVNTGNKVNITEIED